MPASRIIQVDESKFETELDRMVSKKVEEILNAMLDAEAEQVVQAGDTSARTAGRPTVEAITNAI